MALIFDRKAFKSGIMIIKEAIEVDNKVEVTQYTLKPSDLGKSIQFKDDAKILAKYPHCFKKGN